MKFINPSIDIVGNYTKIPNSLLYNNVEKLSDIQRSFLFYIYGNINPKTGYAEISLSDTNRDLGYSKSKTVRVRNELVQLGFVHFVNSKNRYGGNGCTRYFVVQVKNDNKTVSQKPNLDEDIEILDNVVINSEQRDGQEFVLTDRPEFETTFNKFNNKKLEKQQQNVALSNSNANSYKATITKNKKRKENSVGVLFINQKKQLSDSINTNNCLNALCTNNNIYSNTVSINSNIKNSDSKINNLFPQNDNGQIDILINELTKRNVSLNVAKKLINEYDKDIINTYINYTDFMIKNNCVKDIGAFLTSALKEKYDISSFLEKQKSEKKNHEYKKSIVEKNVVENSNKKVINLEKDELFKARELFDNLPDNQKHKIDEYVENVIDEKFNKPRIGRSIFKEMVLRELAIENNWDFKNICYSYFKID